MPDPVCHSKACAEDGCKRSQHRAVFEPPSWRFGPCFAHRGCEAFEAVESLGEPLPPLLPVRSADGTERAGWPEEAAYWTDDADGDPGGPLRTEEVVSDGGRLTDDVVERVEGPAPQPADVLVPLKGISKDQARNLAAHVQQALTAQFLGAYDSWLCETCGSRRFEPASCCDRPMVPIRMEMHSREVPRGAP